MGKTRILFIREETAGSDVKCDFGEDGTIFVKSCFRVESSDERELMLEDMGKFVNEFFSVSYAQKAEDGYFFRFTSDKDEFRKIQDGKYTQSVNHVDNRFERGISVSADMSYLVLGAYDYFYVVSGKVIGRGSDGEPLLDAATMEKHSPYKSISYYCKKAQKKEEEKKEKFLQEYGWDEEQLRRLMHRPATCKMQYVGDDGEIADFSPWGSSAQKIFKEGEFEEWQKKLIQR